VVHIFDKYVGILAYLISAYVKDTLYKIIRTTLCRCSLQC